MAELHIENRGTPEYPFGYVYHGDDARSWFAIDKDADEIRLGGSGSGYWKPLSGDYQRAALVLLAKRFGEREVYPVE